LDLSYGSLKRAMAGKGYAFFVGEYNLNLIGVRSADLAANTFNDFLCAAFELRGNQVVLAFEATTDPGVYYRENPANVAGTAILVPGQYRGMWQLGLHQGAYAALVQRGKCKVYRDRNRDQVLDVGDDVPTSKGFFGINCHRANAVRRSVLVDRWSAGCQVLACPQEFDLLMATARKSAQRYGNVFSYTLLEEQDLTGAVV
jgi:hypothetical protein